MTTTVYSTGEVDSLIGGVSGVVVHLTAGASGAGATTISRQAQTTVVVAANPYGASTDGFKCDTSFAVGDVLEFYGDPTTADGAFQIKDENNNYIAINQFLSQGAPFGAKFRKVGTAGGSARNWVVLL